LPLLVGILIGFLIARPTKGQAPQQPNHETYNEDYFSEDIIIKNNAVIKPTSIPIGESAKPTYPASISGRHSTSTCETYKGTVEKYFGEFTTNALFVAERESGCRMEAVSRTQDYCIFQINREPATANDVDLCVRRAYEKFVGGRVGSNNFSAWYAVCTSGNNPQPKYEGIKCQ
jgi:hypothetical protein